MKIQFKDGSSYIELIELIKHINNSNLQITICAQKDKLSQTVISAELTIDQLKQLIGDILK